MAVLASLLILGGCSFLSTLSTVSPNQAETVLRDQPYGELQRQRMDIYLPADTRKAPLVVFFHGGAWQEGDRTQYGFVGERLAAAGMIGVVPGFRLYPEVSFPRFMKDAAAAVTAAVDYARRELGQAHPSVRLAGHSSGAHMVALLAMAPDYLAPAVRDHIAGWVGLSGPYRFELEGSDLLQAIFAGAPSHAATQPLHFASTGDPPALLIHGRDDDRVEAANSQALYQALADAEVPVVLCELDAGHASPLLSIADPLAFLNAADDAMLAFLALSEAELSRIAADFSCTAGTD